MRSLFVLGAVFALTMAVPGPQAAKEQPTVELPPEIDRVLRDYEKGWAAGDGAALAELFTKDGYILPPDRPPVQGREAISQRYPQGGAPLYLRPFAYEASGSVGYVLGGYASQKGEPDRGKFTLVLRKVEGKWFIVSDMDSMNSRRGS